MWCVFRSVVCAYVCVQCVVYLCECLWGVSLCGMWVWVWSVHEYGWDRICMRYVYVCVYERRCVHACGEYVCVCTWGVCIWGVTLYLWALPISICKVIWIRSRVAHWEPEQFMFLRWSLALSGGESSTYVLLWGEHKGERGKRVRRACSQPSWLCRVSVCCGLYSTAASARIFLGARLVSV